MMIFSFLAILQVGCGPTLTVQVNAVNKGFVLKVQLQIKAFLAKIDLKSDRKFLLIKTSCI